MCAPPQRPSSITPKELPKRLISMPSSAATRFTTNAASRSMKISPNAFAAESKHLDCWHTATDASSMTQVPCKKARRQSILGGHASSWKALLLQETQYGHVGQNRCFKDGGVREGCEEGGGRWSQVKSIKIPKIDWSLLVAVDLIPVPLCMK